MALVPALALAVEAGSLQGAARGFPEMYDAAGKPVADGNLAQWVDGGVLHVKLVFDYADGRRTEENATFEQQPALRQLAWSFAETRGGAVARRFDVDLATGKATAHKVGDGGGDWRETLDLKPGQTFAGIGFMYALSSLRERLLGGEKVELVAVAFTPKPRAAGVAVTREGEETLTMGGRSLETDRMLLHPEVPAVAKLFVKVPDQRIWIYHGAPTGFVQSVTPEAENGDPMRTVQVLPGPHPARAAAKHGKPPRR